MDTRREGVPSQRHNRPFNRWFGQALFRAYHQPMPPKRAWSIPRFANPFSRMHSILSCTISTSLDHSGFSSCPGTPGEVITTRRRDGLTKPDQGFTPVVALEGGHGDDDQPHSMLRKSPFRRFKLRSIRTCAISTAWYSHWSHIDHVAPCFLRKRFSTPS